MKTLIGLPALPPNHWWQVSPSSSGTFYKVGLYKQVQVDGRIVTHLVASGITRSWPAPNLRSIVRTAQAVHRKWLRRTRHETAPVVGKFVGK